MKYIIYGAAILLCVFILVVCVIKYGFWLTLLGWFIGLFVAMGLVWAASLIFRFSIRDNEGEDY